MPKQRPPFDYARYASLKALRLSQRQIAREMGMPEATLRNNLKVYQGSPTGVPTTSTEVDQGTPTLQDDDRSTQVSQSPPTSAPDMSQVSQSPPRDTSPVSTQVYQGPPLPAAPRSTQVSPGGLTADEAHDLRALLAWWRQRSAGAPGRQGKVVRHTFHIEAHWLEAIRREAETTGESLAAVLNRALAAYFEGR